jgi:uncharacterized protein
MIFKLTVLAAVIYGVYFFFFRKKNSIKTQENKTKEIEEDTLVECKKCGTYISTKDAIISNGDYYCSKECVEVKS